MRGFGRVLLTVGATTAVCIAGVHACQNAVIDTYHVTNESMLPYLNPGTSLIIAKTSPCLKIPFTGLRFACTACEVGRAYVFTNPQSAGQKLVKFAMPTTNNLFTRDRELRSSKPGQDRSCYFEGSNRERSIDSRHFGAVPFEQIEGKVIFPATVLKKGET